MTQEGTKPMFRKFTITLAVAASLWAAVAGAADPALPFDQSFLADYSRLERRTEGPIADYAWAVPDIRSRLGKYPKGFFVDTPEILISPDSPYKGGKPEDLAKVGELMREALVNRLQKGGYAIATAPGPGVLVFRIALTDLKMKKNKRNVLAYTPAGAVLKAGADALRDMMQRTDIIGMTLQAELLDGGTDEVLVELVIPDPTPGKRIEFEQLRALVDEYGARARCRIDNARLPESQHVNCFSAAAREARPPAP